MYGSPPDRDDPYSGAAGMRNGTVLVSARGGAAHVYVDGRNQGTTPRRIQLPAGTYTLDVVPLADGMRRRVRVQVTGGATRRVSVDLE